jgi:hypothetical protein
VAGGDEAESKGTWITAYLNNFYANNSNPSSKEKDFFSLKKFIYFRIIN